MKRQSEKPTRTIEQAITDIRNTPISSEQVDQAATRVLATLNAEHNKVVVHPASLDAHAGDRIRSCADFQSLIPAYVSASLTPSRKLLFEDHVRECIACRRALDAARGSKSTTARPRFQARPRRFQPSWAVAAAVVLIVVFTQRDAIRDFIFPIDVHAVAQTVNGGLFRIAGQDVRTMAAGERIERYQAVRTGNDSGAVLQLADGSKIEMNARSEISLDRANDGVRIQLARGSVIVTAAKQRTGHLYVATTDCTVSVVGTVFSVNSGSKGSRVSVIEGEVRVQQGQATQALLPGQQMATTAAMGSMPVEAEIAWSRDRELHLTMLKEVVKFGQDLAARLATQELRHTSNLVTLVPANTFVFISLPNVSQPVAESYQVMKQRIAQNPMLQQWWAENASGSNGEMSVDEMVGRVTRVGAYLGTEIVLSIPMDLTRRPDIDRDSDPVLLADVARHAELISALRDDLSRVSNLAGANEKIHLVQSAAELAGITDGLIIYVDPQLMVVGLNASEVQSVLAARQQPSAFTSTALYQRIAQAYNNGVGWLLAANLNGLIRSSDEKAAALGVGNVEQFVIEQRTGSGGSSYQAVLGFKEARSGVAAWLGTPGPVGAAEFVSPNAYGAAALVTRDPALILDDLFAMLQNDPNAFRDIQQFQQEHRIDIRYDLAAPLGNEFLIAVDGPLLPVPSWKLVVEVKDAARLQNSLEWVISEINREAAAHGRPGITSSTEVVGGRTFYAMKSPDAPADVHYTFWAGYIIVAPSRVLLEQAIQYHDTGNSLARSEQFRAQFPADGRDNASAYVYQNLQAVAAAIPVAAIQETLGNALPTLVCLYGESDRITMSSKGMLGENILNMAGLSGMIQAIGIK